MRETRKARPAVAVAAAMMTIASIAAGAAPTLAQQAPTPAYISVYTAHVKLGHNAPYEATLKKLWAALKKAGGDFAVQCFQSVSQPGDYNFVTTLSNMAEMDHQNEAFGRVFATQGELIAEFGGHTNGENNALLAVRADLSFQPANPRVAAANAAFSRITWLYPQPEHVADLEGAIKEFGALAAKKGINDGFQVFNRAMGEGPVYAVRTVASSEADFYAQQAKNQAAMGADGQALTNKVGPWLVKIEYTATVARADLGYQP